MGHSDEWTFADYFKYEKEIYRAIISAAVLCQWIAEHDTLLERDMRKEDLRLAAGMTTNMIANMSKEGKHISMDTLARICETLNCEITDVIELVSDERL